MPGLSFHVHGHGRQGGWMRRLWWVVILAVCLGSQGAHCDEIFGNAFKVIRDLPELGQALKSAVKNIFQPVFQPRSARTFNADDSTNNEEKTYCFGVIGCISITSDFYHPIYRPINLAPSTREEVAVTFKITSKEDTKGVIVPGLNIQKALESSFKPNRPTKVIIHGFLNGRDMPFLEEINQAYLRNYDVNTVYVDWTDGSIAIYNRAVANSRLVGLEIAYFINWMRDNMGLKSADVHLIGHSLGAHIAGYAGENIPDLGRITGLDPAEPFFQHLPKSVRLDPSDAKFVDVIHTDSESIWNIGQGFGLRQPVGHLDFYPNDGQRQPGCQPPLAAPIRWLFRGVSFLKVWHAVEDALGCNHKRAVELFANSVDESSCPYMSFRCSSYEDYKAGKCTSCGSDSLGCAPLGHHADAWAGVGRRMEQVQLFSSTGKGPKYCKYHYQVTLQLDDLPGTGWDRMGKLYTSFLSANGNEMTFDLTSGHPKRFTSGGKYTFFLEHDEDLGDHQEALVKWVMSRRGSSSMQASLALRNISIVNVDTLPIRSRRARFGGGSGTLVFCNASGGPAVISDQGTVKLHASHNC